MAATLGLALLVRLGASRVPSVYPHFLTLWLPGTFALVSILGVLALARLPPHPRSWILATDLSCWAPLLLMLAHVGPRDVAFWLALAICMKTGVLLVALALAVAGGRVSDRWASWLLVGVALLFFLLPLPFTRLQPGLQLKGDEPHYMVATISLLNDRDLFLEDEYAGRAYAPFYNASLQPQTIPASGGHSASAHDAGLPILAAPAYALGGWIGVLVFLGILAGLTLREIFLSTRLLGVEPVPGLVATVLVGFSLPFAVYATQVYAEIPGALAVAVIVRQMLSREREREREAKAQGEGMNRKRALIAASLALAALPWLHVRFWVLALPLLAVSLAVWRRWTERLFMIGTLTISTALYVGMNTLVYGRVALSPFLLHDTVQSRVFELLHSLQGLITIAVSLVRPFLDPYDGLLLLTPVYLLALAAIPLMLRRSSWVTRGMVVALALYAVFVGLAYLQNDAGDSPPGRFMVVIVPLLALPLAHAFQRGLLRLTLWPGVVLAAWGALTVLVSLASPLQGRYPYAGLGGPIAILSHRLGVPIVRAVPAFDNPDAGSLVKATVWVGAVVLIAVVLWRVPPPRPSPGAVEG